ncbi:MAG: Holliday junction branch migration protein RuvA [Hyphomicrobiales bacterium]|nr:Holliday junction branch migration protein RuvA [Hyphomicrobiales bacterium]
MIGKLRGQVDGYGEDFVILDVNGVGYLVHCSARSLQALPQAGMDAALLIETQVREDAIRLFGFRDEAEREWFRLLQTVQGVGAKVALAILSTLDPGELATAVASRDKSQLQRASGVGARLAERLVTELKDKAPALTPIDPLVARLAGAIEAKAGVPQPVADAISALTNLGYGQPQASAAIAAALKTAGENPAASQLIKLGLKELAR